MPRTGRRPGAAGTKERILAAARQDFSNVGYGGVTIRGIAAQAKVDPALVLHYFESKDGMFRAAVEFPVDPKEFIPRLLAPGLDGLGARLVKFFLETWDSPAGSPLLGLIRSIVGNEEAAAIMREFVTREVLGRLAKALEVDHPELRASLVASQLIGLAMLRYVVKVEPLASARVDDVVAWLGPTLQLYLTDPGVTRLSRARRRPSRSRGSADRARTRRRSSR
ncbi:MAG TPA: TetR family transcriptional regulator [Candidatus Nitrosopolaris sp.]|nr:TetR family transcriptional regulator [Candidatus Nitrosopolaris sp.]